MAKREPVKNEFVLLKQRRFLPFFITQFLGAFNDNVFKNALIIMIAFQGQQYAQINTDVLVNLSAGLFILPFFLFSATAGQWIEKQEKSRAIRLIKLMEVVIMLAAALAFWFHALFVLIALLFLMGAQSTLFGPAKYSYIPQHLSDAELIEGNALVQMGTFVAILLGTMLGGVLIAGEHGRVLVAACILLLAAAGYLASRFIPHTPASSPGLEIDYRFWTETWRNIRFLRSHRTVFLSVLGVSWFWFLGASYLVQLPNYTRIALGGDEQVVTLMLTLFTIGIGAGSLVCNALSGGRVELGLVPLGSLGLTLFGIDLFFARPSQPPETLMNLSAFLQQAPWRLLADIVLLGFFGGLYIVPLLALIQQRSASDHLSRVIAGNNILNALFMVASALFAMLALGSGMRIEQLFLTVAILNAVVALYIYSLVPEFFMRFMVWMLIHTIYRVRSRGLENIPDEGAAVLVCNHVSYVDAMIIAGCIRRPVRFVMYYKIYQLPVLNFVFRTARAIPIAGKYEDEALLHKAFEDIDAALDDGDLVCIFPEGRLTRNGEMATFRDGVERIVRRRPVAVVPMALRGLWGSAFSRHPSNVFLRLLRGFKSRVELVASEPVPAEEVDAGYLQRRVQALLESNSR